MGARSDVFWELMLINSLNESKGDVVTSIGELALRCGYTESRTRRALKKLEKKGKISIRYYKDEPVVTGFQKIRIKLNETYDFLY